MAEPGTIDEAYLRRSRRRKALRSRIRTREMPIDIGVGVLAGFLVGGLVWAAIGAVIGFCAAMRPHRGTPPVRLRRTRPAETPHDAKPDGRPDVPHAPARPAEGGTASP